MKLISLSKKTISVVIATIIFILSLSCYFINADAETDSIDYVVYNSQTGQYIREYSLEKLPLSNFNSRTVIGEDTRVADNTKNGIVKIINNDGVEDHLLTGFVIDKNIIATAAHGVKDRIIEKIILFNENGSVSEEIIPVEVHYPKSYHESDRAYDYDYALIKVNDNLNEYRSFNPGVIIGDLSSTSYPISITGFPGELEDSEGDNYSVNTTTTTHQAYTGTGVTVYDENEKRLYYTVDTSGGNSGGPVYITETINGETHYTVIAVHARSIDPNVNANFGVRMSTDVLQFYLNNVEL